MAEILVKPPELRQAANDLRAHAKRMQAALDAVDTDMRSLAGNFEGMRAEALQTRYNKIREQIYQFKPLIDHFAKDLDEAATRFQAADRA